MATISGRSPERCRRTESGFSDGHFPAPRVCIHLHALFVRVYLRLNSSNDCPLRMYTHSIHPWRAARP
eukprot:3086520-Prymnesium_polylepis.1